MLHPKYARSFREIASNGMIGFLSAGCMNEYAILYYKKYIGDDYGNLASQLNAFYSGKYRRSCILLGMRPIDFWLAMKDASYIL